ncbi:MAG: Ig-like domain-containing protein [Gemmatimonadota bacterium]
MFCVLTRSRRRSHLLPCVLLAAASISACGDSATTGTRSVNEVSVTPSVATLNVGTTLVLDARATNSAGVPVDSLGVFWSTSDSTVAAVSSRGVVSALRAGQALIAATTLGKSATATIRVNGGSQAAPPPQPSQPTQPAAVATVTVSLASGTVKEDDKVQATAVLRAANGTVLTGRTVTWSTSAASLATVTSTGIVTAKRTGTVTIIATSEGVVGSTPLVIQRK